MRSFHLSCRTAMLSVASGLVLAVTGCATTGSIGDTPGQTTAGTPPTGDAAATGDARLPGSVAGTASSAMRHTPSSSIGSVVVTNPLAPRTVDLTLRPDDIWDRVRNGFAIPNIDTPLVAEQQAWYLSHPESLRRAVDRSSLYLFHVVQELNNRGMPTELALLPFVESSYNPMAYSRAHASGMWQFIPGTGRDYNLKQDWWRDERRDVLASTDAALTYLRTIYEMHGDWHLALASYNWGEGAVKRAIERNQAAGLPTDYLSLPMPDETRNYVPKLQALKNIIANPDAFGVTLPKIDNQPYFVAVERSGDIDVQTAARLANMTLAEFRALNPSYNRPVIRASSGTPLLVPAGRESEFRSGLANEGPLATWQAHTVARKESIESIAARYGMTAAALREVNSLGPKVRVRAGQGLLVQKKGPSDIGLRFASFSPPTDGGGVLLTTTIAPLVGSAYMVRPGDTLTSIARQANVSPAHLRTANRLRTDGVLVGQRLQIPRAVGELPIARTKVAARSSGGTSGQSSARPLPKKPATADRSRATRR